MSHDYVYYIEGIKCSSCSDPLEEHLRIKLSSKLEHFYIGSLSADRQTLTIRLADDGRGHKQVWSEIKQYIEEIGFICQDYHTNKQRIFFSSHWLLGIIGCIAGVIAFTCCFLASGIPAFAMILLAIFSTLLTIGLGASSYYDAWLKSGRSNTLTIDTLFAVSSFVILIISITALFVPWLPMIFEAGLLIYGFRHIGIAIETSLQDRTHKKVSRYQDRHFQKSDLEVEQIDAEVFDSKKTRPISEPMMIPFGVDLHFETLFQAKIHETNTPETGSRTHLNF